MIAKWFERRFHHAINYAKFVWCRDSSGDLYFKQAGAHSTYIVNKYYSNKSYLKSLENYDIARSSRDIGPLQEVHVACSEEIPIGNIQEESQPVENDLREPGLREPSGGTPCSDV